MLWITKIDMTVSSQILPSWLHEHRSEKAKRNGGSDFSQSRRSIGAWKCICCTTAFFLLPSSGRFNHIFYLTCNSIIKTKCCRNLLTIFFLTRKQAELLHFCSNSIHRCTSKIRTEGNTIAFSFVDKVTVKRKKLGRCRLIKQDPCTNKVTY